jgi:hypothetical protein
MLSLSSAKQPVTMPIWPVGYGIDFGLIGAIGGHDSSPK